MLKNRIMIAVLSISSITLFGCNIGEDTSEDNHDSKDASYAKFRVVKPNIETKIAVSLGNNDAILQSVYSDDRGCLAQDITESSFSTTLDAGQDCQFSYALGSSSVSAASYFDDAELENTVTVFATSASEPNLPALGFTDGVFIGKAFEIALSESLGSSYSALFATGEYKITDAVELTDTSADINFHDDKLSITPNSSELVRVTYKLQAIDNEDVYLGTVAIMASDNLVSRLQVNDTVLEYSLATLPTVLSYDVSNDVDLLEPDVRYQLLKVDSTTLDASIDTTSPTVINLRAIPNGASYVNYVLIDEYGTQYLGSLTLKINDVARYYVLKEGITNPLTSIQGQMNSRLSLLSSHANVTWFPSFSSYGGQFYDAQTGLVYGKGMTETDTHFYGYNGGLVYFPGQDFEDMFTTSNGMYALQRSGEVTYVPFNETYERRMPDAYLTNVEKFHTGRSSMVMSYPEYYVSSVGSNSSVTSYYKAGSLAADDMIMLENVTSNLPTLDSKSEPYWSYCEFKDGDEETLNFHKVPVKRVVFGNYLVIWEHEDDTISYCSRNKRTYLAPEKIEPLRQVRMNKTDPIIERYYARSDGMAVYRTLSGRGFFFHMTPLDITESDVGTDLNEDGDTSDYAYRTAYFSEFGDNNVESLIAISGIEGNTLELKNYGGYVSRDGNLGDIKENSRLTSDYDALKGYTTYLRRWANVPQENWHSVNWGASYLFGTTLSGEKVCYSDSSSSKEEDCEALGFSDGVYVVKSFRNATLFNSGRVVSQYESFDKALKALKLSPQSIVDVSYINDDQKLLLLSSSIRSTAKCGVNEQPEPDKGRNCLSVVESGKGWFSSPPNTKLLDWLNMPNVNSTDEYSYTESQEDTDGYHFAGFYETTDDSQGSNWCRYLKETNFAGRNNWTLANEEELTGLLDEKGDYSHFSNSNWPAGSLSSPVYLGLKDGFALKVSSDSTDRGAVDSSTTSVAIPCISRHIPDSMFNGGLYSFDDKGTLSADLICPSCNDSNVTYQWVIDMNDDGIFDPESDVIIDGPNLSLTDTQGHDVKLLTSNNVINGKDANYLVSPPSDETRVKKVLGVALYTNYSYPYINGMGSVKSSSSSNGKRSAVVFIDMLDNLKFEMGNSLSSYQAKQLTDIIAADGDKIKVFGIKTWYVISTEVMVMLRGDGHLYYLVNKDTSRALQYTTPAPDDLEHVKSIELSSQSIIKIEKEDGSILFHGFDSGAYEVGASLFNSLDIKKVDITSSGVLRILDASNVLYVVGGMYVDEYADVVDFWAVGTYVFVLRNDNSLDIFNANTSSSKASVYPFLTPEQVGGKKVVDIKVSHNTNKLSKMVSSASTGDWMPDSTSNSDTWRMVLVYEDKSFEWISNHGDKDSWLLESQGKTELMEFVTNNNIIGMEFTDTQLYVLADTGSMVQFQSDIVRDDGSANTSFRIIEDAEYSALGVVHGSQRLEIVGRNGASYPQSLESISPNYYQYNPMCAIYGQVWDVDEPAKAFDVPSSSFVWKTQSEGIATYSGVRCYSIYQAEEMQVVVSE